MIDNIRFKIIAEKLTKFTRFLPEKMPNYIIRQRDRGQVLQRQMFEAEAQAEAQAKILSSRPL